MKNQIIFSKTLHLSGFLLLGKKINSCKYFVEIFGELCYNEITTKDMSCKSYQQIIGGMLYETQGQLSGVSVPSGADLHPGTADGKYGPLRLFRICLLSALLLGRSR